MYIELLIMYDKQVLHVGGQVIHLLVFKFNAYPEVQVGQVTHQVPDRKYIEAQDKQLVEELQIYINKKIILNQLFLR